MKTERVVFGQNRPVSKLGTGPIRFPVSDGLRGEFGRRVSTATGAMDKVEVRSLADGAWYEAYPGECSITWTFGKPFVRIKFA